MKFIWRGKVRDPGSAFPTIAYLAALWGVVISIGIAVTWGGLFTERFEWIRGSLGWLLVWISIDIYSVCLSYMLHERRRKGGSKMCDYTIQATIFNVRHNKTLRYAVPLADRLDSLYDACVEEADEHQQKMISIISLQILVTFLENEPHLSQPELVVEHSGYLVASWHRSNAEHFSVTFQPDGNARYVVFVGDPIRRHTGSVQVPELMETVKVLGVLCWAARI